MDCQLSPFIYTKIKVMKRGAWASQTTVISSFVCWPCTMPVSRHSCEDPNLLYGVVSLILPENILDQFDIVKLEDEDIARNDGTYQPFKHNVHIYLDEQDNRTAEQRLSLKPNGFTEYTSVKDYPVRNRLLTLHIRRRRYLDAEERSVILSEFPLKADGTSISPEFADFLKRRS